MPARETPRGKIRVQIPGYAWLDALRSSFIADNESWWERREHAKEQVAYVAFLDPDEARMVQHALEGQSKVTLTYQHRWALERACLRIEADINVLEQTMDIQWPR